MRHASRTPDHDGLVSIVKVHKALCLVCAVRSKIAPNDDMPSSSIGGVKERLYLLSHLQPIVFKIFTLIKAFFVTSTQSRSISSRHHISLVRHLYLYAPHVLPVLEGTPSISRHYYYYYIMIKIILSCIVFFSFLFFFFSFSFLFFFSFSVCPAS